MFGIGKGDVNVKIAAVFIIAKLNLGTWSKYG